MPTVRSPDLTDDEVHVWTVPVRASEAAIAELERVLGGELERASRFRFPHLRESCIVSQSTEQ
jgi:hypothetical protein